MNDSSTSPSEAILGASALAGGLAYQQLLREVLDEALAEEREAVRAAADVLVHTFQAGGLLYIFGSGHSHMFAEEAFYRAGGAVQVCPVLKPPYMLHAGAVRSTRLERESGHAEEVLAGYRFDPARDCMLVVSNSGVNPLPVEVAQTVKSLGLPVLAITSRRYADSVARSGPRLHDVVDVVIDNHCPPGDALVSLDEALPATGPASTVVGLALLNTLIVEACALQLQRGGRPQVFLSANMPGARDHNEAVVAELSEVIPHL
ncbi:sugar isomerase domain-containing protein [Terrabacter terrigena]|uniref:Sugar isomerase domain-containing protein n=1 Tax=Terrabacter terrigena TaxID=574718 RepID=A0ABW3N3B9_9MICO